MRRRGLRSEGIGEWALSEEPVGWRDVEKMEMLREKVGEVDGTDAVQTSPKRVLGFQIPPTKKVHVDQ